MFSWFKNSEPDPLPDAEELAGAFGARAIYAMAKRLAEQANRLRRRAIRTFLMIFFTVIAMVALVVALPPLITVAEDLVLGWFGRETSRLDIDRLTREQAVKTESASARIEDVLDEARQLATDTDRLLREPYTVWYPVHVQDGTKLISSDWMHSAVRGHGIDLVMGRHDKAGQVSKYFVATRSVGASGREPLSVTTAQDASNGVPNLTEAAVSPAGFVVIGRSADGGPVFGTLDEDGKAFTDLTAEFKDLLEPLDNPRFEAVDSGPGGVAIVGATIAASGSAEIGSNRSSDNGLFLLYKPQGGDWKLRLDMLTDTSTMPEGDSDRVRLRVQDLLVARSSVYFSVRVDHRGAGVDISSLYSLNLQSDELNISTTDAPLFGFGGTSFVPLQRWLIDQLDGPAEELYRARLLYVSTRGAPGQIVPLPVPDGEQPGKDVGFETLFGSIEPEYAEYVDGRYVIAEFSGGVSLAVVDRDGRQTSRVKGGDSGWRIGHKTGEAGPVIATPSMGDETDLHPAYYAPSSTKLDVEPWNLEDDVRKFLGDLANNGTKAGSGIWVDAFIKRETARYDILKQEDLWYDERLIELADKFDSIEDRWKAAWETRNEAAQIYGQLRTASESSNHWRNISSISARLAVIALLVYMVNILVNLYRYNLRLAGFYQARSDALYMALASSSTDGLKGLVGLPIDKTAQIYLPEEVTFGARPATPLKEIAAMVEKAVTAAKN